MTYRLGKQAAVASKHDLLFAALRDETVPLPPVPLTFGHEKLIGPTAWGMLGNDRYGDCVFAGAAHEEMLWQTIAGRKVAFSEGVVLKDYGAVTGFDPSRPDSDQGTVVRDALGFRRRTGVRDISGARHKIGAFVAIEPGNWLHVLEAAYLFSAVGIGFQVPDYCFDAFDRGLPWTVRAGSHPIEGGHYVPVVGKPTRSYIDVVTWGRVQRMSRGFFEKYCDEAWGILSPSMLKAGHSIEGFDMTALTAFLNQLD